MHKTVQICAQNEDAEVCEDVDRINFLREENLGWGGHTGRLLEDMCAFEP